MNLSETGSKQTMIEKMKPKKDGGSKIAASYVLKVYTT